MVLYIGCSCPTGKLREHNKLDRVLVVTGENRQESTYVLTQTPHHKQAKQFHVFYIIYGLPWWFSGKESAFAMQCNAGDPGSNPGSGRCPGEGNGNPLQYSCLEIPRTEEPVGL